MCAVIRQSIDTQPTEFIKITCVVQSSVTWEKSNTENISDLEISSTDELNIILIDLIMNHQWIAMERRMGNYLFICYMIYSAQDKSANATVFKMTETKNQHGQYIYLFELMALEHRRYQGDE